MKELTLNIYTKSSHIYRRLFIFLILLRIGFGVAATTHPLEGRQIRYYTVTDGLASNAVYSIFQDSKGLMWFGTIDGLHSFDGYLIKPWRDENLESLGSIIFTISEDDMHRLWIGTNRGLALYDLVLERFLELPVHSASGVRIKSPVFKIVHGGDGLVWLATQGEGVFSYNRFTGILKQYSAPTRILDDNVSSVTVDADGNVWSATHQGVCRYNADQDRFVTVPTQDGESIYASSIYQDLNHNIWIGTKNNGIYFFDRESGRLVPKLRYADEDKYLFIRDMVEWEPGYLFLLSDMGLTCYDITSGDLVEIKPIGGVTI